MITSEPKAGERIKSVEVTDDVLRVDLLDGRTVTVPLVWFPRLLHATAKQRQNWRLAGAGYGIHWPDVDEDLTVQGLLHGSPAPGALSESKKRANSALQRTRPARSRFAARKNSSRGSRR